MTEQIQIALIATSGTFLTAVTALIVNARMFSSLERRIEVIEKDLKDFFRLLGEYDKRIQRLEG